ncbi:MAG: T9SS type A sorting domain-containing protein [Chitinophagaceae bacterium]|nr:T9SS type A sorting domain-containing protein [Chitinophagaceae bacterium]MCB9045795.1 T9SS type A sorting domain-containing protein [Chitinophagales bacterium]
MKRICLAGILAFASAAAYAQAPVEGDNTTPVLFRDVVEQYEQTHDMDREEEFENGIEVEGEGYHYDRWKWYWSQHLDENGYMVSSAANFIEGQKAQNNARSKTTANQSDWKFVGPTLSYSGYGGIGRVNCVAFHPTDSNTYWVGTAGGGAWKTTNDGATWTAMTHSLAVLGVSDIDINPKNPNTIYLCPGDRDASDTYSLGVLKSTDGGATWGVTGLTWTPSQFRLTNCLVINPQDTNSLTVATSVGIYKSYNGGANWTSVQSGHFKQVVYHPTDTSILYAPKNDGTRDIYRSTDGGATWTTVTSFNNARRIQVAVTPANPSLVMAVVCNSSNGLMGIYKSTNSGASFSQVYVPSGSNCNSKTGDLIVGALNGKGCGNQGWYDLTIAVNPTNANEVYVGGVNTYGSNNGGVSWSLVTEWYSNAPGVMTVHADKHAHEYHPLTGELFEGNDGGLYKTRLPQSTLWTDISNGLGVTQFYRNAVTNAANYALGGAQDNGSKGWQGGTWYDLTGGDGMECQADPLDSNVFYTAVQNGELRRTTNGGNSFTDIQDNIPGKPSGAWITPYLITPDSNMHLIAGYKEIYYSPDRGNNWMSIQGSEITGGKCYRLAMTGGKHPTIYALFPDTQVVFYAKNYVHGATATFDTIIVPYSGNMSDIKAHPTDSGRFFVSFSGYNTNRIVEYNKGVWTPIAGGLPNIPVKCIEYDSSLSVLYVGTDIGVYYRDTSTNNLWASFQKNMPSIEVTDLGINYTTKEIWASTYGRGMWNSVKQGSYVIPPDTTDTTDTTNYVIIIPYADDVFRLAPNPSEGQFKIIAGPSMQAGKALRVNVIDFTGKTVVSREEKLDGGKRIDVDVKGMPPGVYIVELKDHNSVLGRKRAVIR